MLDASTDYEELRQYPGARRILKELEVFEASAVYAGAGIRTGTDSAKGIALEAFGITPEFLADLRSRRETPLAALGITPELAAHLESARTGTGDTSRYIDLGTI